MFRRSLILFIVATLVIGLVSFASLGQDKPYKGETVRWAYIGHTTTPLFEQLLDEFESETGIDVKMETINYSQLMEKMKVQFSMGRSDWDVVYVGTAFVTKWIENGWVTPLDQFIESPELVTEKWLVLDDFYDAPIDFYTRNGKLWALPAYTESLILHYRKDLFEKYDIEVPETYEELEEAANKLHNELDGTGIAPIGYRSQRRNYNSVYIFGSFLFSYGGNYFNYDTMEPTVNSPEAIEAAKAFTNLLQNYGPEGASALTWTDTRDLMLSGKLAMLIDTSGWAALFQNSEDAETKGKMGFAPLPKGPGGSGVGWSTNGLFIPKFSDNKEAAWQLIQWAGSPVTRLWQATHGSSFIDRKSVVNNPAVKKVNNDLPGFLRAMDVGLKNASQCYFPCVKPVTEVMDRVGVALSQIMTDQLTAEEALNRANKDVRKIMEEEGYYK